MSLIKKRKGGVSYLKILFLEKKTLFFFKGNIKIFILIVKVNGKRGVVSHKKYKGGGRLKKERTNYFLYVGYDDNCYSKFFFH